MVHKWQFFYHYFNIEIDSFALASGLDYGRHLVIYKYFYKWHSI